MALQATRNGSRTRRRVVLVVLAIAVYLAMWFGWTLGWGWVTTSDASALDVARGIANGQRGWVTSWNVLCTAFSPLAFRVFTLGVIVYAVVTRQRRVALFLLVGVELSGLVTEAAKRLADRPRPTTAMVHDLGTSFPSGHALGSMVAVLSLGVVLAPHLRRSLRPWATGAVVLVVVLAGVGRVALNVHNPSDVLAGWALGYVYFAVCLPVLGRREAVTSVDGTPATPGTAR